MCAAEVARPISLLEAQRLFHPLTHAQALVLAVSGGPDSTALLLLAARWRSARKTGPELLAATVDHGLRPQSKQEARAVARLACALGVQHRTLRWRGKKPASGIQEAARAARYALLVELARATGADHIVTAHTLDDQAETVLMRMSRGSGMTGLGGMRNVTPLWPSRLSPRTTLRVTSRGRVLLVRPLIDIPKARLVATLERENIAFSEDASNRDPRFARARLRKIMPALSGEGLDARRLAVLARRLQRADTALETAVDAAARRLSQWPWERKGPVVFDRSEFLDIPAELGLRLLGRAVDLVGSEGPVELGKLEKLYDAVTAAKPGPDGRGLRRALAGAVISIDDKRLTVERAPPRRNPGLPVLRTNKGASRAGPPCDRQGARQSLNHRPREASERTVGGDPTKRKIKKKGDSSRRRLAEGRAPLKLYPGRMRLAPALQEQAGGSPTAMKDTG